jgi:hypothetical protein
LNDQSIEITSELRERDTVVPNQTQTTGANVRGFAGGPALFSRGD